ncbi:MAG TPA: hypothetical protein VHW44_07815 [Pseudonocardiaceae bacterium]|nr:hypothetical protein [Pseudonocardiaceae bacterium]
MLYLVPIFILVAFGLLLAALVSTTMLWAWLSLWVTALGAVVLIVYWVRRRRGVLAADDVADAAAWDGADTEVDRTGSDQPELDHDTGFAQPDEPGAEGESVVAPSTVPPSRAVPAVAAAQPAADLDLAAEPAEEQTDVADVLAVNELSVTVVVVDERPRYHLTSCAWLAGRRTIGLPVREARQLGFTPCAVCTPDRTLAAAARKGAAAG